MSYYEDYELTPQEIADSNIVTELMSQIGKETDFLIRGLSW